MSWSSSRYGGDSQRTHENYNQPLSRRQPYDDRSQQAGPSSRPYHATIHDESYRDRYDSYSSQPYQSWDQQRQPQYSYPDRYEPTLGGERRRDDWAAESVRTQPGHDHFYNQTYGADRYAWASDRYTPSYRTHDSYQPEYDPHRPIPQQRSYSTQSYRRDEEDRYRPSAPARPSTKVAGPSDRRVSELAQKKEPSSYIAPHRRGQSAPIEEGSHQARTKPLPPWRTTYDSPAPSSYGDTSFDTPTSKSRPNQEFVITLPSPRYIALSDPTRAPPFRNGSRTKLLVLDLNGALIYRDKRTGDKRRSFPRPYLASFLQYLFVSEPDVGGKKRERAWEVFVWSSAQPHNVRAMVEGCFGMKWVEGVWEEEAGDEKKEREQRGEGRLFGVWARDKLGLDEHDYRRKVQTVKDLRVLSNHLSTLPPPQNDPNSILKFDESNIVLLDDSPLKAIHQPWNEIILPEYEKQGYQTSKSVAELSDSQGYVQGMDDALLCVIGMLEGMRDVENVPAWIRGGGLTPSEGSETTPPATSVTPLHLPNPTLDSLPTHSTFIHWHSIPEVRSHWLVKGLEALKRKGIEIRHGIDPALPTPGGRSPMWSAPGSSGRPSREMNRMNNDEISIDGGSEVGSPKQGRKGGWSPSRRNTPSPSPMPLSPPMTGTLPLLPIHAIPAAKAQSQSHTLPPKPVSQYRSQPTRIQQTEGEEDSDIRCTFPISDIARFLSHLSDRALVSLTEEQRRHLAIAGEILASFPIENEINGNGVHTATSREGSLHQHAERGGPTLRSACTSGEDGVLHEVVGGDGKEGGTGGQCAENGAHRFSETHTKQKTSSVTQTIPPTHNINTGRSKPNDQLISTVTFRPGGQIIIDKGRSNPSSHIPHAQSASTELQTDLSHDTFDEISTAIPVPKRRLHKRDIAALDRLQQYITAHTALLAEVAQAETHPVGTVPGKHISAIRKYHKALQRLEGELRTGKKIPEVVNFFKDVPKGGVLPGQKILDQLPPHVAVPSDNPDRTQAIHETTLQSGLLKAAKDAVDRLIDGQQLGGSYVNVLVAEAKRELGISSSLKEKKGGRLGKRQMRGKQAAYDCTAATLADESLSNKGSTSIKDAAECELGQAKRSYDTALGGKADIGGSLDVWPPKVLPYAVAGECEVDTGGPERSSKRAKHTDDDPAIPPTDFRPASINTLHRATPAISLTGPEISLDTSLEKVPVGAEPDGNDKVDSQSQHDTIPAIPVPELEVTAESHPDLCSWSNQIYLHRRIPEGSLGHLTFLVVKQIYQDLRVRTPHSDPSHIGQAVLGETYATYLDELFGRGPPKSQSSEKAIVDLALEEAKRFIRVKSYPLVEDIPKPETARKRTIDKVLEAAARDLPPLEKCQVSQETAGALAARRETGASKISLGKVNKQGKGTKRKQPESHNTVPPSQVVIKGSIANVEAVNNERTEQEQRGLREKQKKMYTATNKEPGFVKHLPTLAQLGTYKDEEWL